MAPKRQVTCGDIQPGCATQRLQLIELRNAPLAQILPDRGLDLAHEAIHEGGPSAETDPRNHALAAPVLHADP
eukprot:8576450-Alexandrium_andersonii.AAC.1